VGLPVLQCPDLPVGTGLTGNFADQDILLGLDGYRIDVSTEAGNRFDADLTGLRAEEDFGYNAEPYVRTGMLQKILGL
jgi:hypothetical protein